MRNHGMSQLINKEIFIAMVKVLEFIDPHKISVTVVLTAMYRFPNKSNGIQMVLLNRNHPNYLFKTMDQQIKDVIVEISMSSSIR